jgi:hypothetical protein
MSSLQDVANELDNERWGAELNGEYHADVNALLATIKALTDEIEQINLKLDSMIIVNGQALACSSYVKDAFEQLKANEQRYIEALVHIVRHQEIIGGGMARNSTTARIAREALAQSPQQVEVYRTGQAVIEAAINWDSHTPTRAADERSLIIAIDNHRSTIDKADNGE